MHRIMDLTASLVQSTLQTAVSIAEQQVYIDEESDAIEKTYQEHKRELNKISTQISESRKLLDERNT